MMVKIQVKVFCITTTLHGITTQKTLISHLVRRPPHESLV